ncbi:MAG: sigma-70 family RNA polymerase sigma factor [Armatimonadota bacterium]|jgi:RNA polymerase sigma-70 factor (ECF subfamily)|nr:sigma-70 family RNA polymerase sigma factor [Armatimonadota bacterium]MDT7971253.1 sigma-70 family RNA polymerase sigma factor [Armatimonadota bacterium]
MARTHLASWLSSPDSAAEFEAAVLPLRDELRRVALRLTQSPESAEDLVQETLLHAFQGFGRFRRGTNLRAWLMRILLNLFISHYRHQQRSVPTISLEGLLEELEMAEEEAGLLVDESAISPEDALLARVLDEEVERALEKLPDAFREAVILCDLQGLSYAEAAQQMGVPIGTVRSRLSRGREILRRLLWDYARKRRWV